MLGFRRGAGLTLPEILISIVILAVGIMALVVTQAYAARARSLDQTHLLASQRANSALASIADRASDNFDQSFDESNVVIAEGMSRTVTVTDAFNGSANLRLVTVEISYRSNHNTTEGKTLVTRVLRRSFP
jgi:prepilin-type N-terminal cleavage/methylation domain-containing protein